MLRPLALVLLLLLPLGGCGRQGGAAPRRVIEREETVAGARVRLRSELLPARGTLGDRIAWRLTATLPPGLAHGTVHLDPAPASLEMDTTGTAGNLFLRGFDLGAIPLPRATLALLVAGKPDTLEFPRDTLYVDSLTAQATGQLRPDRGPITPPLRAVDYAVLIAALGLLALVVALLLRALLRARRRKGQAAIPPPPEPAESVLARELDQLERELGTLPRDVFYERLAQSLRGYAAAATGVDALDLTTAELDRALGARASQEGRERLIRALRRADLAKFARWQDAESEARSIVREARAVGGAL